MGGVKPPGDVRNVGWKGPVTVVDPDPPLAETSDRLVAHRPSRFEVVGPAHEPGDLAGVPVGLAGPVVVGVPTEVRSADQTIMVQGDERYDVSNPRGNDVLAHRSLHVVEQHGGWDRTSGRGRSNVRVDQVGELLSVPTGERTYLKQRWPPSSR